MHNIKTNFDKFYSIVYNILKNQVTKEGNFLKCGRKPKFSDLDIITLSLVSEALGIDSENYLFGKLEKDFSNDFPNLIHRSQYNIRRKKLFHKIDEVRTVMAKEIIMKDTIYIVDSMPVEVCKISRASRSKICKEEFETSPDKGYCAAQKSFYYGYKLHGLCSFNGVFTSFDMTKASVHDIHYLQDVKEQIKNSFLLGDKAYLSEEIQTDLFSSSRIRLETPSRINQYYFKKQSFQIRKTRKRIETLFSQLCDQFMIRRNYAKSFYGLKIRILCKITALTILQFINKFITKRNLNNIKYALA
jgi:hypothetical protein